MKKIVLYLLYIINSKKATQQNPSVLAVAAFANKYQILRNTKSIVKLPSKEENNNWEANTSNIKEDFETLRIAHGIARAEIDLEQKQRALLLQAISQERHAFVKLRSFDRNVVIKGVLLLALSWKLLFRNEFWKKLLSRVSSLQYWFLVVLFPLVFFKKDQRWDSGTKEYSLRYNKNEEKEVNYISILLEYCITSSIGFTFITILLQGRLCRFDYTLCKCLNRASALMSLHQFPLLTFEHEKKQNLPMTKRIASFDRLKKKMKHTFWFCAFLDLTILFKSQLECSLFFMPISSLHQFLQRFLIAACSLTIPIIQIISFSRLIQIQTTSQELTWKLDYDRTPKSFKKLLHNWYKFLLLGPSSSKQSIFMEPLSTVKRSHLPIVKLLQQQQQNNVGNRSKWVENSINKMKEQHQESYDSKQYDDVLGMAAYFSLNLGLSYDYDVDSFIEERPSLYRLHSRACRTAIQYIESLKNTNASIEYIHSQRDYYAALLLDYLPARSLPQTLPDGFTLEDLDYFITNSIPSQTNVQATKSTASATTKELNQQDYLKKEFGTKFYHEQALINEFANSYDTSEWEYVHQLNQFNFENTNETNVTSSSSTEYYFA